MRFLKTKKGIAMILSFVLLVTTLAVCIGVMPTSAASDNLLDNGSFETADGKWNSAAGKSGDTGYSNFIVGHGQDNLLADGWNGTHYHNADKSKRIFINHSSDAHTGNYALNVNIPSEAGALTLFPKTDTLATSAIEKGYYTLTAWVKSNNTSDSSVIEVKNSAGTVYTQKITAGSTWHKIEIDGIYLESPSKHFAAYRTGWHIRFVFAPDSSGETTYITVDDVSLTRSENLLSGGSFETTSTLWQTSPGYTDKTVAHGQSNLLTDGWYGQNYWVNGGSTANALKAKADHIKDAVAGSYSLKIKLPATDTYLNFYPKADSLDASAITDGYYSYSIWMKSDNRSENSYLEIKTTDGTVYRKGIPVTDSWQEVTIDNIYLSDEVQIATTTGFQHNGPHILLRCQSQADKATYIQIDNARLTKLGFLTNPDFENELSAWKADNGGTNAKAEISDDASKGEKSVKITLSDENSKLTLSEISLPKEGFTEGYYMWAFDAKGTAKLTAKADSDEYKAELTAEWKRFVIKDIDLAGGKISSMSFNADGKGEIFIDNIEFYRQVGPGGLIDSMTVTQENGKLKLPEVPSGYQVTVLSSSNTDILALDGTLTSPEADTEIEVVLKITNINDATDTAKTDPFKMTIKPFTAEPEPPAGGDDGGDEQPPEEEEPPVVNPPEETVGNVLINAGFEMADGVWDSNKGKSGPGFENKVVGHGQHNLLADGWYGFNWLVNNGSTMKQNIDICTTHTTDAHSGDYALKFTLRRTGGTCLNFYPKDGDGIATDKITAGTYKLTLWVKGTNNVSTITVTDKNGKETTATITAINEWQQIVIDNIDLSAGFGTATVGSNTVPGLVIKVNNDKTASADTELYIDDICFEKITTN